MNRGHAIRRANARLRALVRRGGTERAAVIEIGDLRLDPAAHQCRRGDTEILLSPREFAVLEYLAHHAGVAVSKRTLLEHVWDFAFEGDDNIVEVYVRRIRRKIDEPFGRATIQTVRGAGYRIDPDA